MSAHQREPAAADLPPDLLELAAERLLAVPPADRPQVLSELVRERPGLEVPLRRLAEDLAGAERLLDEGFGVPVEPMPAMGPYRVLRVIGEGAFGVVYLCAQDVPVRREVAVKLLRPGAGDRHTLARFEAERHVLARLSHPAIAQVFDAGALPDGRPWFVMEYVDGLPITGWCDRHRLGIDARLSLFVRLCQGVHHAHTQGIVHRDLKPANILVYEQDGQPRPKIIDFGIAKAVHATERAGTIRTETGRVVGTPGYMSPEQSTGNSGEIDARADVFSLGVILYELLTGELPWGRRPETTESDPPRPSVRVATDTTGSVARQRATPPRKLASRLRDDLDWIVLQALSRERERRYGSAHDLAADLVRHRRGRPVLAGPPALGYRLRKFARRRRTALGASVAVPLALAIGLWTSLSFRKEAMTRTADLEATAASLLARANDKRVVHAPQSEDLRKALVQDALGFYERFLRDRPEEPRLREGRARALWTLSQVQWLVGEYAQSEAHAREAVAESDGLVAAFPDNVSYRGILGNALRNLGRAMSRAGKLVAAREAFDRAVHELDRCHAEAPSKYADLLVAALMEWSSSLTDFDTGVPALRRAVAIQEGTLRERPSLPARRDLMGALVALGHLLILQGELQDASRVIRRADELLADTPDAGPSHVSGVLGAGATLAARRGNHAVAVQRLQKAVEAARKWSEQEPTWQDPLTKLHELSGMLAVQLRSMGDHQAAAEASRAAIAVGETRIRRVPDDHLARGQLADHLSGFAKSLLASGRRDGLAEAEECARRALQLLATIPDSVDFRMRAHARWLFLGQLGLVLDASGDDGARTHWEETSQALDAWRDRFGVNDEDASLFVEATLCVAASRFGAGLDAGAAKALAQADAVIRDHSHAVGRWSLYTAEVHRLRALMAARRGEDVTGAEESERARSAGEEWQCAAAGAEAMHAVWRAARAGGQEQRARADRHRDRAIELHRAAMAAVEELLAQAPGDPWGVVPLGKAGIRLAEMLLDRGEGDAARELLAEVLPALAAARDEVHADRWDEALYLHGKELAAR